MSQPPDPDAHALRLEIEALLNEPVDHARVREKSAWKEVHRSSTSKVVIHGMGRVGRIVLAVCRDLGIEVQAFCDRAAENGSSTCVDGVPVLDVRDAATRYGREYTFIASIWSGTSTDSASCRMEFLRSIGCAHVIAFPKIIWAVPTESFALYGFALPSFFLAHASEIRWLSHELTDVGSLSTLLSWLRRMLLGDFRPEMPAANQYFPSDLFVLHEDEVVVDVGAFTGDTLDSFLSHTGGHFTSYHAFEPDERSIAELRRRAREMCMSARIFTSGFALGREAGRVRYRQTGGPTSMLAANGETEVEVSTLDLELRDMRITFLKLDVEGAEADVLDGGRSVIAARAPTAAVCVYHRADDYWVLAGRLKALLPNHRLFLRMHGFDGWETVLYAVAPRHLDRGPRPE